MYPQKVFVESLRDLTKRNQKRGNFAISEKFDFEKPYEKYLLKYEHIY